jgi:hypothetical protein
LTVGVVVVGRVGGTEIVVVGGGMLVAVVVVSATVVVVSATVVVVVSGATVVVSAGVGVVVRGAVVLTGGRVLAVVSEGPASGSVTAVSTLVDGLDVDDVGSVVGMRTRVAVVVVAMVLVGDSVATCCFGEWSPPVATSNKRATRAIEASA